MWNSSTASSGMITVRMSPYGRVVFELMGLDYDPVMENPGEWHRGFGKTYGELLVEAQGYAKEFIKSDGESSTIQMARNCLNRY